jgi:hypothetical protein
VGAGFSLYSPGLEADISVCVFKKL